MSALLKAMLAFAVTGNLSFADTVAIPQENIDGAAMPDFKGAQDLGASLVKALLNQDPKASLPLFFPEEPYSLQRFSKMSTKSPLFQTEQTVLY